MGATKLAAKLAGKLMVPDLGRTQARARRRAWRLARWLACRLCLGAKAGRANKATGDTPLELCGRERRAWQWNGGELGGELAANLPLERAGHSGWQSGGQLARLVSSEGGQ